MEDWLQYITSVSFVEVIQFIGTVVFAISGIRLAAAKEFDWFGAFVVGFVTAIGGGTIRDVLLGVTPFWMLDPEYIYSSVIGLIVVLIYSKQLVRLNTPFFIFDTIGLGLFVVVGIEKTIALHFPFWVAVVMGTITGVAGGILRDIFINEIPLLFRKEIYALACVLGGVIYVVCYQVGFNNTACQVVSIFSIIAIRVLAVKYQWGLPKLKLKEKE
ncbi:MAG: trimeric intracellular cation channel family protein [Tannerella sp.]|nr:trimeric intracellular cation channel family protein [Tannerella sp.]